MDSLTVQRLSLAWMRRKRWENRALAGEIVSLLAQAMGGGKDRPAATKSRPVTRIPAGEMLAMMGVKL